MLRAHKNLRVSRRRWLAGSRRTNRPSSEGLFVRRRAGDLARPLAGASQLRDSTGIAPASLRCAGRGICARLQQPTDGDGFSQLRPQDFGSRGSYRQTLRLATSLVEAKRGLDGTMTPAYTPSERSISEFFGVIHPVFDDR